VTTGERRARLALLVLAALALTSACDPIYAERPIVHLIGTPGPDSTLIGCDQASTPVTLTASAHLDPACTYVAGLTIGASDVVLDCRGATIESAPGAGGIGISVSTPADTDLSGVTVRNCVVKGFLNGLRVTRVGFRSLTAGHEYDHGTSSVVVERSNFYRSSGSGVFVDAYVTGVTLRGLEIAGAGGVGIYLEAGSKSTTVVGDTIYDNGFADTGPDGVRLEGTNYRYHSTGREGIAVDGSRDNVIRGNRIAHNSAGGIFLYKNCGEYSTQKPAQWWNRPYGADGNLIEGNTISSSPTGVWVGSRMSENQLFMDCSDPAYVSNALNRIVLDHARDTTITDNDLVNLDYGVRVEDDGTRVTHNRFRARRDTALALVVGTRYRKLKLGLAVTGTVVDDNRADITGNATPYRSVPGAGTTTFTANLSGGAAASLVPAPPPPVNPFLFVKDFWTAP
jgi:parallel beta-helix repeat protein